MSEPNSKYSNLKSVKSYTLDITLDKAKGTIVAYLRSIDRFFDFLNVQSDEDIKNVGDDDIVAYQHNLKKSGLSASSINSQCRNLSAFFSFLKKRKYVKDTPLIEYLKEPNKMNAYLEQDEITKIIGACKNIEEKTIFLILVSTGLRRGELVDLRLSNQIEYSFLIKDAKGEKERYISLPDIVYDVFLEYLEWREKKYGNLNLDYVFISKNRNKYSGEAIRQKLNKMMERAGLPQKRIDEIHPHSLRHTFTANLIEGGIDIKIAQVALGHADLATTSKIYAHVRNKVVEKAMRSQNTIVFPKDEEGE